LKEGVKEKTELLKNPNPAGFEFAELISPPKAIWLPPIPSILADPPGFVLLNKRASLYMPNDPGSICANAEIEHNNIVKPKLIRLFILLTFISFVFF
tara:strand:+ start:54 stop:344 length:291 start_codon:yes stop_codon:yes gene_type:complete